MLRTYAPDAFMAQQYGYQYGYATGSVPPQSTSPNQQSMDPNGSPTASIQYPGQGVESPQSIQFNQGQPQAANGHYIITNGYGFHQGLENGTYVSQIKPEETDVDQGEASQMVQSQQYHTVVANGEMLLSPSYSTQPYQYVLPEPGQVHQVVTTQVPTSVAEQLPPVQVGSPHNLELNMGSPQQQHQQQAPQHYDSPEAVYNQSISSSDSFTVKVEANQTTTLHPMG